MEPLEAARAGGYGPNRNLFAVEIHHLSKTPMYLRTHIDGVASFYHCTDGETAKSATDSLIDHLGAKSSPSRPCLLALAPRCGNEVATGRGSATCRFMERLSKPSRAVVLAQPVSFA